MVSPRAHIRGEVIVVVPKLQAGEGASLPSKAIAVGVGRPLGWLRVDPCWLAVPSGLESPWGQLLCVWPRDALGREGSTILMPETSCHDEIDVVASLLLTVVAVCDGE